MIAAAPPLVKCRCCGKPMDVQPQTSWKGDILWIITCWREGCPMQGQTSTTGDYPALDLSLYNVVALEALNTGDVYLDDQGYPVTVIRRDGDHAFVREEGSDWLLEVEMDEQLVKVTARATFALVSWAAQYIDGREWRVCVGE